MMADENQSSTSSAVEQKTKPSTEEEGKEDDATKAHDQDSKPTIPVCNGHAKTEPETTNNNQDHKITVEQSPEVVHQHQESKVPEEKAIVVGDHENNNNCADSLEVVNNNEVYVEEKTFTSELETSLVVKQVSQEEEEETVAKEDHVAEETMHNDPVSDGTVTTTVEETTDGQPKISSSDGKEINCPEAVIEEAPRDSLVSVELEKETTRVEEASELTIEKVETLVETKEHVSSHEVIVETTAFSECSSMKSLEIPTPTDEEGDGFVPLAECLPHGDENEEGQELLVDTSDINVASEELKVEATTNGYAEHLVSLTPETSVEEKANHPEMEQFVKSGGVKRILPGVQKTEQPYSSCTTETKIAMEIREMREREEELRVQREQSLLSPVISPVPPKSPCNRSPSPSVKECISPTPAGPGYRVSSVFGHRVSPAPPAEEERKVFKPSKESAVEKEIRLAREREEELRNQKGLPPREDDSYVKPSQVKSSQVRIFGKAAHNASVKQAATAKIQLEIEEQTQREMALRDTGSIQTISQERTDAKVAKLMTESTTPPLTNGNSIHTNGNHTNGRHSPDVAPYKRSSPSPTGLAGRPASIFSQSNGKSNGISMQKFIASKGKETAFNSSVPRNGNFILAKEDKPAAVPPTMVKLKRTVSVESKIQQEIMEMKQREEELKKLHMPRNNDENFNGHDANGRDHEMNQKNTLGDYENGLINEEDLSPRHNKLIAQWEQRIQKAES